MLDNILDELNIENAWCILLIMILIVGAVRVCPALASMFVESFTSEDDTPEEPSLHEQYKTAQLAFDAKESEIQALIDEVDVMCESEKETLRGSTAVEKLEAEKKVFGSRVKVLTAKEQLRSIEERLAEYKSTLLTLETEKRGMDKKVGYQRNYANKFGSKKTFGADIRADLSDEKERLDEYNKWANAKYKWVKPGSVRKRIAKFNTDIKALNDKMTRARQQYLAEQEKLDDLVEEVEGINEKIEEADRNIVDAEQRMTRSRSSVESLLVQLNEATAELANYEEVTPSPTAMHEDHEEVAPSSHDDSPPPQPAADVVIEHFAEEQPIGEMTSKSSAMFYPSRYAQWESLTHTDKQAVLARKNQLLREAFSLPQP